MKKLHRMIVASFVGPLVVTFAIVVFMFVMQFLWKYVDDLMGKGLEWYVVLELLTYAAASFVPPALPTAIMLAAIMTMGGLGENSELIPMRSAGLGLPRIMFPLVVFAIAISAGSFYFSNDLLPIANLKFKSLLWDLTEKKPALNIKPGVFYNGIDGFSIRVMEKDADTGRLTDVLIYDHRTPFKGNSTVIRAKSGTMRRSTDGRYLVLTLEDGHFYDEQGAGDRKAQQPLMRGTFARDEITMDLSGLGLRRTDEDLFKENYKMLTMAQLQAGEDSLIRRYDERVQEQVAHLRNGLVLLRRDAPMKRDTTGNHASMSSFLNGLPTDGRNHVHELAMNMARNNASFMERAQEEMNGRNSQLAKYRIEWHRKPMLAVACLVFFFIGAPLGAIIRKGGMGLPVVVAILFFLLFHILSFSTEKLVIAGGMAPWPGMWISTLVLVPIGLWLTWKAAVDSPLFDRDAYYRGWERFRSLLRRSNAHPSAMQ